MKSYIDPVEQVGTHDNTYVRGDERGYIRAMIEARCRFERWILAAHLDTIIDELAAAGASVSIGPTVSRRPYGVHHRMIRVKWVATK